MAGEQQLVSLKGSAQTPQISMTNSNIKPNNLNDEVRNSVSGDIKRRLASKKRKNLFSYFQDGGEEAEDEETRLARMF